MGQWIDLLTVYGVALVTIATVVVATRFAGRRGRRAGASSPPVLVVTDGAERHRPAA